MGRLDLIAEVPGLGTFDDLADGATTIELGDLIIPVLTLEQLIQAKSALDNPKIVSTWTNSSRSGISVESRKETMAEDEVRFRTDSAEEQEIALAWVLEAE